jgi:SAM-dependent methyltransferase
VHVNGAFLGTQQIDRYGTYYFRLEAGAVRGRGPLEVCLSVDHAQSLGEDPRSLGVPVYDVSLVDFGGDWDAFEERRYLRSQIDVFVPGASKLPAFLGSAGLSEKSLILDVGAGMGWTTTLLAALTGARVVAVDLHDYASQSGPSFKEDLCRRFERHAPLLVRLPGFEGLKEVSAVVDRCSFWTMDAKELLLRDACFDFVFSLNSFEHISDPARALQEIERVLRPNGRAFIQFSPLYHSDSGHHLHGLLDVPWAHLCYDRAQIKQMIRSSGKPISEVDQRLDSLNGYSAEKFLRIFDDSGLRVLEKRRMGGFSLPGAAGSKEFRKLRKRFSEEELTGLGVIAMLEKN